jgi:hypothetical protein
MPSYVVVCNLDYSSKCRRSRERSGGNVGLLHDSGMAKKCKSVFDFGYAHGKYLMARTIIPLS